MFRQPLVNPLICSYIMHLRGLNFMKKYLLPVVLSIFLVLSFSFHAFASSTGQDSSKPESGWKRFPYSEFNISYEGQWKVCEVSSCTKNVRYTSGSKMKFNFVGEQFRFISYYWSNGSTDIDVYIDGVKTGNFSLIGKDDSTSRTMYESPILASNEHSVEIVNNTTDYLYVVALDLPDDSTLQPFDPKTPEPEPEPKPEPKPEPEPEKGERAILVVTMTTGLEKEFDLSMREVNDFINWYENKQAGSGTASYAINKHNNNKGPFSSRKDFVIFDKILTFEVNEYSIK